MKFLIDMPLSPSLAEWLAACGHDAVHASNAGLHSATDEEIIFRAKNEGRTVVTADLDYPRLLTIARAREPSLILFRSGDWTDAEVRLRLDEVLQALTEADIVESIVVVDRERVRRRRLPIDK